MPRVALRGGKTVQQECNGVFPLFGGAERGGLAVPAGAAVGLGFLAGEGFQDGRGVGRAAGAHAAIVRRSGAGR
jgi:hypothetical protein